VTSLIFGTRVWGSGSLKCASPVRLNMFETFLNPVLQVDGHRILPDPGTSRYYPPNLGI